MGQIFSAEERVVVNESQSSVECPVVSVSVEVSVEVVCYDVVRRAQSVLEYELHCGTAPDTNA